MSARKSVSRRMVLKAGALISVYPAPQLLGQTPEPLKIGFLTVLTGPLAAGGQQQEEGAALFLSERNGMIAGRKVELIAQDTGGNPALAKTKTQELVERYKVPVMIGPLATNEAIAMDGYIRETKVPLITTTSAATVDLKSHAVNTRPRRSVLRRLRSLPKISPTVMRAPAAFISRSRRPVAKSCRSSGPRSTRLNTRPT